MIYTLAEGCLRGGTDILAIRKGDEIGPVGTSAHPGGLLLDAMGGGLTTAGVRVTPDSAMRSSAVNACVRVYAESVASLPLLVYRRMDRGKERFSASPLYSILHDQPNPWMSSFEWRELMERHRCVYGNAYSLIERNRRGDVTALFPLDPARVTVMKGNDRLPYYRCSELSGSPTLPHSQVFHLRNSTKNGYEGIGYFAEATEAVGLALALEQFGASLFGNGANMRGFFKYGAALSPEKLIQARDAFRETYIGLKNSNLPGVLDGTWDWVSTSMKAEEAQFLASRYFQVEDVARMFRMPTLMIGHADKTATYASAEQFFLAFVVHTLTPVLTRWEGALKRALFTDLEQDLYPQFLVAGLLRGDIKSRYAAYAVARQWGWLNADEIREFEDLNPLPDGKGQIFLEPLNMVEAGTEREKLAPVGGDGAKATDYITDLARVVARAAKSLEVSDED